MPSSARFPLGRSSVPVLCYHNLGGNGVARDLFSDQMRWLADHGVQALDGAGLLAFLNGQPLNDDRPAVCITFDDGFRDIFTFAAPLLAELGLRALVFLVGERIRPNDQPGLDGEIVAHAAHEAAVTRGELSAFLSQDEIRELTAGGTVEWGCHTRSHALRPVGPEQPGEPPEHWAHAPVRGTGRFAPLAPEFAGPLWLEQEGRPERPDEFEARLLDELTTGRADLEARLGVSVRALAWPWGAVPHLPGDEHIASRTARQAGFELAFGLARGPVCPGSAPLELPRVEVRRKRGMAWFAQRMHIYSRCLPARLYSAMQN